MTVNYNGINVEVYRYMRSDWRIKIGGNIYSGFTTRKDAIASIGKFI